MKEIVIDGNASLRRFLRDLWDYRELFYFLAWRDFLVRYKQTVIGLAWSVLYNQWLEGQLHGYGHADRELTDGLAR
jgi:hypothetical protein